MTAAVLERFERAAWPAQPEASMPATGATGTRIDVASQLRKLW
jgi:hypothetical protein